MAERLPIVVRSLEAAYWRALGKKVRANNVMSGARETFVEKLKQNYFRGNGAYDILGKEQPTGAGKEVRAAAPEPAPSSNGVVAPQAKAKAPLPIPFYGVRAQSFQTREVIFTCVVGDRHALQPVASDLAYEHVLYVDRDVSLEGWNQRPLLFWDASPKLITLFHKFALCSLMPEGTKMLWLDSRVHVTPQVARTIFATLDASDVCLFRHHERNCVYDEILAVLQANRSTPEHCEEYARFLRERSFPRSTGLFETGAMGFRVGPHTAALFRKVFGICYRYVPRDQLALPVALAGSQVKVQVYDDGVTHLRNAAGVTVKSWKESR